MNINIAILGFGTVGSGVAEVLDMNRASITEKTGRNIVLKHILDLREFPDSPYKDLVTHDAEEVFNDPELDIVVETIGGARIAYEFTKRALSLGKSVVTSNKELVSTHGVELLKIAAENNCSYLYEAAVGGGIPIIRPLYKCLAANEIVKIAGIVNGTTNYILSKMKDDGLTYEEALKGAQANGFAEANPTADVDGIDAQRKLSILSTIALNGRYVAPDRIHTEGISNLTLDDIEFEKEIGATLKLIAYFSKAEDGRPCIYVAPHYVSGSNLLSNVGGVFNAIMVEGNALGESMYYGKGAGMLPTASAVCSDILEAATTGGRPTESRLWREEGADITPYEDIVCDIVVRSDEGTDRLKEAFSGYDVSVLSGNAVLVKSIRHKDIDLTGLPGAKYFHYLG